MGSLISIKSLNKEERYEEILPQIESLINGEADFIANLANVAAALKLAFKDEISWVGFYLAKSGELVLGPFQGKPACVRIQMGRGVCGTAAKEKRTVIVPDVSKFPGHIYCDPDSKSEIVVPLMRNGEVLGVLDVDSSSLGAFDETDMRHLERVADMIVRKQL
ncbi:MAG: GAF domain-containing protein [Ignavibacteriales bacterium]|nr:GAF domain-containing protein [Ignavibacteriales bacterium]